MSYDYWDKQEEIEDSYIRFKLINGERDNDTNIY